MRILVGVYAVVVASSSSVRAEIPFPHLPKAIVAVKEVTATSTFPDKKDAYAPWRALAYEVRQADPSAPPILWSAWCEGKKDEGIGEALTVTFAEPTQLDSVKVAAGVWRSAALHTANNQITSMDVIVDGKPQTIKPSGRTRVEVKIGAKVTTLAFKITGAKKGRMNDTCIAGIDLMRGGDQLVPLIGMDARALASLPTQMQEIQTALAAPGRKGLDTLLAYPFTSLDADGFFMGGSKQGKAANWAAVVAACKTYDAALKKAEASGVDYVDPRACPTAAPYDGDDDRSSGLRGSGPRGVVVSFTSHREVVVTWKLVFTDRWRLQAISYE